MSFLAYASQHLLAANLSPADIFAKAHQHEGEQQKLRSRYVYRELQQNWEADKDGNVKAEKPYRTARYEHIFLEGLPYRLLIERNGKPLSESERRKVEEDRSKTAEMRRQERRTKKLFSRTRYLRIGDLEILTRFYDLKLLGEETVNGYPVWAIEAEPKATPVPTNSPLMAEAQKELRSYRQKLWIHRERFLVVKRLVLVIGPDSEILPGGELRYSFAPLESEEGVWFETSREIRFAAKALGMLTNRGLQTHSYSDYRKFDVESTITIDPVEPAP